jgi:hypothetical protein
MTEPLDRRPEAEEDDAFERVLAKHPEPTPEVRAAMAELDAARTSLAESLDDLSTATQSALDVPAKIRRNPVKTAALVGGTGFLLVGGPKRVVRSIGRRVFARRPDPYAGLLPPEIEKVLKDSGVAKDPEVRRALNKDFAEYLRKKGKVTAGEPTASRSFWRTFDRVAGPLGTAGARLMVQRLMEAEHERTLARSETRERSSERAGAKQQAQ